MGEAAEVEFFAARPRDTRVSFRCSPVGWTTRPPWKLALQVNGVDWQVLDLKPGMHEYVLQLPARLQRRGSNRLRLVHPKSGRPIQPRKDVRLLWEYLRFDTPPSEVLPSLDEDHQRAIFIPADTQVDFFLELPRDSVLVARDVRARGSSGDGLLSVHWEDQDGERELRSSDFSGPPGLYWKLSEASSRRGRLSLFPVGVDTKIPGSGVVLIDPQILSPESTGAQPSRSSSRHYGRAAPNVIVYLVDTLRADHLGCYGYAKNTSPHIDRFSREGYLFTNAQAQSSWTRSSVASLFTGLLPQVHGANDDPDKLPEEASTLAESLKASGYSTAGITGNGNAHGPWGFAQGFDYFEHVTHVRPDDPLATSDEINEVVFAWLDEHSEEQPFFLYVHTIDPHAPYDPPEPFRSRFAPSVRNREIGSVEAIQQLHRREERIPDGHVQALLDLYDAEIAANDASFGRFLEELKRRGLYDGSVIVFLSDHGEEFYEHGDWTHGKTLHAELLDVPIIVKPPRGFSTLPPGEGSHRIDSVVQHVDIYPTILDIVGAPVPDGIQGRSVVPLLSAPSPDWNDRGVSHMDLRGTKATSLLHGSWKLIQHYEGEEARFPELYSRDRDRAEQQNRGPDTSITARFLDAALRAEISSLGSSLNGSPIDSEELENLTDQLRALGYVE
jgi:arylsulfatase A-like enzyme